MYSCCNRKGPGIFAGYQAFWIIVVIAIVIIWVHYGINCNGYGNRGCGCNDDCGCINDCGCGCNTGCNCGCMNNGCC